MTKPNGKQKTPLEENIIVRVPLGTKATLKAAAKTEGLTVSALIRAAMKAVVKKTKRKPRQ